MWQGMRGGANSESIETVPDNEQEQAPQTGIMSSILASGANLATRAVGGSPEATLELTPPPNQRLYFVNGDEISGALSLEVPNEIQH